MNAQGAVLSFRPLCLGFGPPVACTIMWNCSVLMDECIRVCGAKAVATGTDFRDLSLVRMSEPERMELTPTHPLLLKRVC
eukprot:3195932-Amphidinium_carterae.1